MKLKTVLRNLAYRFPGFKASYFGRRHPLMPWQFEAVGQSFEVIAPARWVDRIRQDDGLGKLTGVDREGRYEAAFTDKFIELLDPSTVLLDVGGAYGLYSAIASRFCAPEHIHVFEPDVFSRWILAKNNTHYCGGKLKVKPYFAAHETQGRHVTRPKSTNGANCQEFFGIW